MLRYPQNPPSLAILTTWVTFGLQKYTLDTEGSCSHSCAVEARYGHCRRVDRRAVAAAGLDRACRWPKAKVRHLRRLVSSDEAGPAWRSMRGGLIDARLVLGLRLSRRAEGGAVIAPDGAADRPCGERSAPHCARHTGLDNRAGREQRSTTRAMWRADISASASIRSPGLPVIAAPSSLVSRRTGPQRRRAWWSATSSPHGEAVNSVGAVSRRLGHGPPGCRCRRPPSPPSLRARPLETNDDGAAITGTGERMEADAGHYPRAT